MSFSSKQRQLAIQIHQLVVSHDGVKKYVLASAEANARVERLLASAALGMCGMPQMPIPADNLMPVRWLRLVIDPKNRSKTQNIRDINNLECILDFNEQEEHFKRCCNPQCGTALAKDTYKSASLLVNGENEVIGHYCWTMQGFVCSNECQAAFCEHLQRYLGRKAEGVISDTCVACKGHAPPGEMLRACSGCRTANYCGRKCQKKDWQRHKKECQTLAAQRDF